MNQLRKFMYGRYGVDRFSQVLIGISLAFSLLGTIFRGGILLTLSYIPLMYAIFRMLSKNISARTRENYKFEDFKRSLSNKINKNKNRHQQSKTHNFYKCPRCKQKIRIPKGKGKICITCPKCKMEFIKKS
jgi:hypothetical protein